MLVYQRVSLYWEPLPLKEFWWPRFGLTLFCSEKSGLHIFFSGFWSQFGEIHQNPLHVYTIVYLCIRKNLGKSCVKKHTSNHHIQEKSYTCVFPYSIDLYSNLPFVAILVTCHSLNPRWVPVGSPLGPGHRLQPHGSQRRHVAHGALRALHHGRAAVFDDHLGRRDPTDPRAEFRSGKTWRRVRNLPSGKLT